MAIRVQLASSRRWGALHSQKGLRNRRTLPPTTSSSKVRVCTRRATMQAPCVISGGRRKPATRQRHLPAWFEFVQGGRPCRRLGLFPAGGGSRQPANDIFQQGSSLYKAGDHAGALDYFRRAAEAGNPPTTSSSKVRVCTRRATMQAP